MILERIFVIIPVLNEEDTITDVIKSLQSYGLTKICVVDNGSSDRSIEKALKAGAEVVSEPIPGYGRACWRGMQKIPAECDWIFFCDGDGSDDLRQLPEFLAAAATDSVDLILGNRRATAAGRSAMTPVQNFGNWLATFLIGLGWGYWYRDLGPLRLIRKSSLEEISMRDRGFGWTVEMQAKAIECHLKICEIPVGYRRRQGGRSKISGTLKGSLQAGSIILATLGKLYLQRWQQNQKKLNAPFPILLLISSLLLLLGGICILPYGNFQQPGIIPKFLVGICVMSLGFAFSWGIKSINAVWFWLIAILTRLIILPMEPGNDIWRYLWEGHIQNLGFNPYNLAPNAVELIAYRTDWWSLINHSDTSAIYPPLCQLGFRLLAALSPSVLLFKIAFIAADLGICWLLSKKFGCQSTLLYAWNPLIIYSFAGGAHYDSWFILPLVAAWLAFENRRWYWSAFFVGISVAIKWVSLPILSFLIWRSLLDKTETFSLKQIFNKSALLHYLLPISILGLSPIILSALNFCSISQCSLIPTTSHFVTIGRHTEFIPYLISLIWEKSTTQNWIYGIPLGLVVILLLRYCRRFVEFAEWYFFALLTLSPIVHAWYFTWSIPWIVATKNLGVKWVSVSAFFDFGWSLTPLARYWIWSPFVIGFFSTGLTREERK